MTSDPTCWWSCYGNPLTRHGHVTAYADTSHPDRKHRPELMTHNCKQLLFIFHKENMYDPAGENGRPEMMSCVGTTLHHVRYKSVKANIAVQPNRVGSIMQTPKNKPCFLYKAILVRLFKKLWLKCYTMWFLVCLNKFACCITICGLEGFADVKQLLICGYPRETAWGSVVLDRYPLEPTFQIRTSLSEFLLSYNRLE